MTKTPLETPIFQNAKLTKRARFEIKKSENMPRIVFNEEPITAQGLEIGHRQQNTGVRPVFV